MDKMTDFKPLQKVVLPGIGELECSGLILIVGPNSAGKTQLLQDIYKRVSGYPRSLVVAHDVQVRKPSDIDPFIECMEKDGYISRIIDDNGNEHLRPQTTFVGTGEAAGQILAGVPRQMWNSFRPEDLAKGRRPSDFLAYFGRLLVTALFLERRLVAMQQVGVIDFESQPPQSDLHALHVNDEAKRGLLEETEATFSRAVWPDSSRGTIMCLRVSDQPGLPSAEDRHSPKKMATYRTIESEGDGLKSYVAICVALLLGRRPVCVLDEPEMCLHPPQAYNLGRFIGRYGSAPERATFVATHSSHILRGVIQTATDLKIVRVTRSGAGFSTHLVPSEVLKDVLERSTVRAETVLDGVFAQAVVVLEADGDRTVYEAVLDTLRKEINADMHLSAVGGTGGMADTVRLYRALRVPVAVIADLDIITDPDRLGRIVETLTDAKQAKALREEARRVSTSVKALPPTVNESEVRERLGRAAALPMDWSKGEDAAIRDVVTELAQDLDRMRRLKRGGVSALSEPLLSEVTALLNKLQAIGVFVVPVGELEGWLADREIGVSRKNKWAWANAAAARVRKVGPQEGDVWDFVRALGRFVLLK
jgi:hypothetical protein